MSRSLVVYDDRSGEILLRLEGFSGSAPTDPKTIMPFAPEGARCRVVEEDLDPLLSASRISPVDSKVIPARILHSPPVSSSGNKVAIVTPHGFVAGTTKYNLVLAQSLIRQGLQASLFFMSPCVEEVKRYLEDSEIPFLVGTPEAAAHFAGEHSCVIWHGGGGEMSVFANELSRLEVRPHSTYVVHMENDFPMVGYAAQIIERTVVVGRWMLSSFPYATWCPPPAVIEPQEGERDPRTMVYLGRLAEHKGLENLVRSLSILEDFRLVLVGAGPLKEELVSLAEGLGCSERLSILGGDMRATRHLSKGGVFVLPSESEGASVALVEALAAGLKVVSTPVGDAVWLAEEKRAPVTLIENNQVASIVSGIVSSFGVEREPVVPPQYTSSHFEQVWRHTLPISLTAPPNAASQGKRPSVSVLMPVYQYKEVMDGAISSVLKQDLGELEVVAVDNGNQDDTYDRLLEWQKQDARVVPIPIEKNVGLPGARNRAARAARGDWVCFLDPDDRYLPGFLGERMEMMRGNKKAVLSIGQAIAVHNGHPCGIMPSAPYDRRVQSGNNRVLCQSVMMPHWALVAAGGNERWRYAEDWGLWARLAAVGEVLFDERPVYELHAHEQQRSRITSEGLQEKYDCNMRASFHNAFCAGFNRPLHVLMVLPDLFLHGAQRMALSVATRLQEAGNTVDVASLFSYDDVPIEWARSGLNMLPAMGPHQLIERAREGGYDVGFIHCWSGGGIVASTHLPLPAVVVHHSVDVDSRPPVNEVLRVHVAVAPKSRARFSFDPVEDGAPPTNTHICNGVDAESIRSLVIGK
jgi:glycosyltransferase involved in cell wall biosynthesis